ncbi:gephyrin-like molybdotransferase receptor GlpR [Corynebacterium timonense]|uniref:Uncharacterized protein n=1 Tax=Corynebacterium timonense TaxID=441500 RepID=A0A1H1R2A0_9CORY|nr:gephyrin-like molybdotransferase receptor GlpR [Corynebacterium timonense]SDS29911.1 hypothetical protein SAMN04488539_1395 [Corynebacterium timonense]
MGSLSLIVVLIIVVWVIVLAPMVMGNNTPIRRSGDGYDETRVLHSGGTAPVPGRRRPKLTRADVHRFSEDTEDYEVVEVEDNDPEKEKGLSVRGFFTRRDEPLEGEVVADAAEAEESAQERDVAPEAAPVQDEEAGSTAYSLLQEEDDEIGPYEVEESYISPEDYGYAAVAADTGVGRPESGEGATEPAGELVAISQEADLTDEDIEFARTRRGRGGWDPEREQATKADRFQRRQRTLAGLIVADVIAVVGAVVAGGWVWLLPAVAIALTLWFMVALRRVVREERALHARRVRQLRRARMGVATADSPASASPFRRPPGAVMVERDDESPDFADLPAYAGEPYEHTTESSAARAS